MSRLCYEHDVRPSIRLSLCARTGTSKDSVWTDQQTDRHTRTHRNPPLPYRERSNAGIPRRRHRHRLAKHGFNLTSDTRYFAFARPREEIACVGRKIVAVFGESVSVSVSALWNASLMTRSVARLSSIVTSLILSLKCATTSLQDNAGRLGVKNRVIDVHSRCAGKRSLIKGYLLLTTAGEMSAHYRNRGYEQDAVGHADGLNVTYSASLSDDWARESLNLSLSPSLSVCLSVSLYRPVSSWICNCGSPPIQ